MGSAAKKFINKIWILQKKAIRVITNMNYNTHTNPLFKKLGILKFDYMLKLHLATFTFKLYKAVLPVPLNSNLVMNSQIHSHFTRTNTNPRLSRNRTSIADRSIFYLSYTLWYTIDPIIKDTLQYSAFVSKYKSHLLHQYSIEV